MGKRFTKANDFIDQDEDMRSDMQDAVPLDVGSMLVAPRETFPARAFLRADLGRALQFPDQTSQNIAYPVVPLRMKRFPSHEGTLIRSQEAIFFCQSKDWAPKGKPKAPGSDGMIDMHINSLIEGGKKGYESLSKVGAEFDVIMQHGENEWVYYGVYRRTNPDEEEEKSFELDKVFVGENEYDNEEVVERMITKILSLRELKELASRILATEKGGYHYDINKEDQLVAKRKFEILNKGGSKAREIIKELLENKELSEKAYWSADNISFVRYDLDVYNYIVEFMDTFKNAVKMNSFASECTKEKNEIIENEKKRTNNNNEKK